MYSKLIFYSLHLHAIQINEFTTSTIKIEILNYHPDTTIVAKRLNFILYYVVNVIKETSRGNYFFSQPNVFII